METWRRFTALPAAERKLVREAARRLTSTWFGLRVAGFARMRQRAERSGLLDASRPLSTDQQLDVGRSIARAQGSAARHLFFSPNCLVQSLTLLSMCRSRDIQAQLRVGARSDSGAFQAHAWVELNGIVLNEPSGEHRHFVPFEEAVGGRESGAAAGSRPR
jgi:hypothetical protein